MVIALKEFNLKLAHTFSISRESHDSQSSLVVSLHHQGEVGYGEATSNPYYQITTKTMIDEITKVREKVEQLTLTAPEDFYTQLEKLQLSNFSLCALDLAANDLYGKLKQKPLYRLWGTTTERYPITNYTIGIAAIEKMVEKMKEKPWPIYKIKLGTDHDVEIVSELRKHTDAIFRIDANCAWSATETIENALKLKELGVEFLEQPLKAEDWEGMRVVKEHCVLPVIADESCILEADVDQCAVYFDGVNIKLVKCGGLTPARRMIANAKKHGLKVMVGCMTESTVGISAIAQLLPQLDYVDMDGAMLLKEDIASGVVIEKDGKILFPEEGGSGIHLLK
ncbi:dipeptide epimerase [Ascidiimonas sp. W6]|uniref:dipeptide epimerase n=1 Tax=Ascidiimonas meishanensis TaxID=3128903 RepID=UPI0030EB9947